MQRLCGRKLEPRRATLLHVRSAAGETIDQALALWFPAPHSFTGEASLELHLHGGQAVIDAVSEALSAAGARLAEPGEFTRRAFEHGKLDLAQAEAVADLVDAETKAQRRQALAQLGGALGARHESWRALLVEILALLEAEIDFPDEEVPEAIAQAAGPLIDVLLANIERALSEGERGERVRNGYRVAIIGAPNAGKSSLLNAMLGRDAAIVTETAGTTRDVIEAPLLLAGYKLLLADTAGIRPSDEVIEREGVRRARAWAASADLRLMVVDASAVDGAWASASTEARAGDLLVLNKIDRGAATDARDATAWAGKGLHPVAVSATKAEGLPELLDALTRRVLTDLGGSEFPAATRLRHQALLSAAVAALRRSRAALGIGAELAAAEAGLAAQALRRVTGQVGNEDVLDRVFASFCIGK